VSPAAPARAAAAGAPGGPGGGGGGGGGGAGGGPVGGGLKIAESMQNSQEDLASNADAITVSGELTCPDDGPYWVYLFPPPPGPDDDQPDAPLGAISGIKLADAGDFSFKAPKGGTAMLLAFRDGDDDGVQKPGEPPFIGNDGEAVDLEGDVSDLEIDCEKNVVGMGGGPPPGADGAGGGEGGDKAGGEAGEGELPPPDGAAGPPPDGAPPPEEEGAGDAP
jgi:hypothetical protein